MVEDAASTHCRALMGYPPLNVRCLHLKIYNRVFHLPRISPILLFKILKLCLTIKLTEMKKKIDSSIFELAQAN